MALATGIQWCDATFNPWWGCERVSPACAHCYADTLAARYGHGDTWGAGHSFRFFEKRHWGEPLKWARTLPGKLGRRPRVFCASMADVFEERPELEPPRLELFALIAETPELDWLLLTKRPEYARELLTNPWWWAKVEGTTQRRYFDRTGDDPSTCLAVHGPLANVWLGVSIENARWTWRADVLREIPAAVRFVSAEPLLGSLFPETIECPRCEGQRYDRGSCGLCQNRGRLDERGGRERLPLDLTGIDWIIAGGESGPKARALRLEHVREIVAAARSRDPQPAVFVKQLGARPIDGHRDETLLFHNRKGGDPDEWPTDLRIREFPDAPANLAGLASTAADGARP